MEELEIKVGMIIKYENISWRIISLVGDAVRMIEMDTSKTRIRTIQIEDILEYISNETMVVVKDTGDGVFDIDSLPKNERLRYEVKKSLVDRIRKMFGPSYAELERGIGLSLLTELCNEFSMSAATVYSIIRKWLQSGFQDTSLIGNKYIRKSDSVRKYKYVSKTGRPAAHKQGVVLDEVVLSYFEEGLKYFKPVAKLPPKAREYSTQTLIDNTLSKTHSPKLAAAVYERVSRNLSEREDSANWSEIANAIVAVMKTKTGMKLDEDQLVTKVLDRVTKSSRKKTMESVVGEAPAINLSTPSNQAG